MSNYNDLPENLPAPEDDGACDHLKGMLLPELTLNSTQGEPVELSKLQGLTVIYVYPMTGRPGVPLPDGWDDIPGARGCTPQSCAFRDHSEELKKYGATVFGLSTQTSEYQLEAAERLHLPFALLSDSELKFCNALSLPTFEADSQTLIKRLTLVCNDREIRQVFYPVFPPDKNAESVLNWLRMHTI